MGVINNADNIMLGDNEVDRVYKNSVIVWERSHPYTYRLLNYLQTTGSEGIITDIIPKYTNAIEMNLKFIDYSPIDTTMYLCGLTKRDTNNAVDSHYSFCITRASGVTNHVARFMFGQTAWETGNCIFNVGISQTPFTIRGYFGGVCSYGNYTKTVNSPPISLNQPSSGLGFGGTALYVESTQSYTFRPVYEGGDCTMQLFEFKVYAENGYTVVINDLKPAERSDGMLGFLDVITDKFYTNAGAGGFISGGYVTD